MEKANEAVRYMVSVWDEVQRKWRESPDHVQQKFLEAEKELLSTPTNEGAKTAYDVLSKYLESCYLTHGEKLSDKYKPYLITAMQEHATQQLAETEAARNEESEGWDRIQKTLEKHLPIEHIVGKDSSKVITEFLEQVLAQLKTTKAELPSEKYISDIAEGLANEYSSDKKDPVWRDIKQDGIKAIKAFIQSLPQSDGQRYGEEDKFMLQKIRRYFLSKSALPFEKDAYLFIDKLFKTLQSKEQEPKGSEERSDKLEAFLDYCNVNKAKIIEDYNKSLAQEPKGSEGEKIDITKQVYGPASSKNYFGDERDGNLTT